MPSKKKNKKPKPKSMTKSQQNGIACNIKDYVKKNAEKVRGQISKEVVDDITLQSKGRKSLITVLLTCSFVNILCDMFFNLYQSCNKGRFMDKYSLFEIKWSESLAECLKCGSDLNKTTVPDEISNRNKTPSFESNDISVVIHAIGASFLDSMCSQVKEQRPVIKHQAPVPSKGNLNSFDTVLGFAGGCMRLVYRKACGETRRLIKLLNMSDEMKTFYTECYVLAPGTSSHRTIPVRALNGYFKLLNTILNDCCTKESLMLYKKMFVKVCSVLVNHIPLIVNNIFV